MQHSSRFLELVKDSLTRISEVDVNTIKQRLEQGGHFHLIDVREQSEWDNGHLPKAMHLSKGLLECMIEKIIHNENAEIVLYCGGGFRSALAADSLQKMGFTNVKSMAGGFKAWHKANYPVETE